MCFRILGEEKHLNFTFSDTVLCFETKTYNIPHNIKIKCLCGREEFMLYAGVVHVSPFLSSVRTENGMRWRWLQPHLSSPVVFW